MVKSSLKWHALYTRGRHEKFIHEELEKKSIESYVPLRKIRKRWSDRTVVIEEPVFSSYVFVKTDLYHRQEVLKTKGAVKFVMAGLLPVSVEQKVIDSLRTIFAQETQANPFPYLKTGDKVLVRSGIFKGVEGFIARKDDQKCRVVISIDAIMSSIAVEVDSCLVDRI